MRKLVSAIWLISVSVLSACVAEKSSVGLPDRTQISGTGAALPIDGLWTLRYDGPMRIGVSTVRIDNGIMYIVDNLTLKSGSVMVKDLRQRDSHRYVGTGLTGTGKSFYETDALFEVLSENELLVHLSKDRSRSLWDARLVTDMRLTRVAPAEKPGAQQHSGRVEIVRFSEERTRSGSELQTVSPGAVVAFQRSRTIEHLVTLGSTTTTNAKVNGGFADFIQLEIGASLQRQFGRTFKQAETYSTTVTLDGSRGNQWRLTWYDRVVNGVARYVDATGAVQDIPFRFPVATELEVVAVP